MHFPRFWTRKTLEEGGIRTSVFGWSDESLRQAEDQATEKAKRNIQIRGSGKKLQEYGYPRGPLREEVVERYESEEGEEAVISRNRYGALVLNAANAMFVDIDLVEHTPPALGFWDSLKRMLGNKPPEKAGGIDEKRAEIEGVFREIGSLRGALYQTHSGFRLLILNQLFDPASPEASAILQQFKSDPLYVKLTQSQKCFRARLTPKPWRIGTGHPPYDFPFRNPEEEAAFQGWLKQYGQQSRGYGICRFLGEVGHGGESHPQAEFIRNLHDEYCLKGDLPLA